MVLRADSGFYSSKVTRNLRQSGVSYSITVKTSKALHKVIAAIKEEDWTPDPVLDRRRRRCGRDDLPAFFPKAP